ncbi:MAG: UvrD-helicase domain-containing protein [Spirochaetales bacterium]|nr:UvrD-helicase domain-containing protein [Spirochaetales bacterium]
MTRSRGPELNPEQLRAVNTHEGPLIIIAGAGSGKTRVITYRVASMLDRGIAEGSILAVTFTKKAAAEMRHRVRELTGRKATKLSISTFHAFGLRVLSECHDLIGYKRDFTVFDETDREGLIKDLAREMKLDVSKTPPSLLATIFSKVKTGRQKWEGPIAAFEPLYREYNRALGLYQAFDFDDLIVAPLALFERRPETLAVYQERFRYIMVDEFQDTSDIQYRLITALARAHGNICVVGDEDQSIYSFRGAHFRNLLRFENDFPGALEIKLERNYRSSLSILDAANSIILNNAERKPKALRTDRGSGEPITLALPQTEAEEGEFIVGRIRTEAQKHRVPYREIGILVRANHLTRAIEEALLRHRIPYVVSGGMSFFNRKEVKDVLSYLTVTVNPDDDLSLLRVINTPRRGLGQAVLEELVGIARRHSVSLFGALKLATAPGAAEAGEIGSISARARAEMRGFVDIIETTRSAVRARGGLAAGVRTLVERIDYQSWLLSQHKKEDVARWKFQNVESLVNSIADYDSDPENASPSLRDYLIGINLLQMEENKDKDEIDKVNLMTVHAAKGLEFEVVFIAGAEEGLFPHERTVNEANGDVEEERRLFYVAVTRAKRKLYISAAATRRRLGVPIESSPSSFIAEIPQELLEKFEEKIVAEDEAGEYFGRLKDRFAAKPET